MTNKPQGAGLSRRLFLGSAGAMGLAAALAACSGPASTSKAGSGGGSGKVDKNGTIEAGLAYTLSGGFDPMLTSGALTVAANWHVLEGLVELDPATRDPYAALGADMPTQVDDTTWEVTLRDGATFHDGSAVTVDDVVFSFERVLNPDNNSLYLGFLPFIEKVSAKDDKTVQFSLKYPFPLFPGRISVVKVVPKALVEKDREKYDALPTGTGPYVMTAAKAGDKITFERFDDYNGPRPALAKDMTWQLLDDAAARVTAMQSNRVQAIESIPYVDVDGVKASAKVESVQSFGLLFMMFNTDKKPFDDKRVRQALFYAVDYDTVIKNGLLGNAEAATSFVQKEHPAYSEAKNVYTFDPDKAKSLLKEAGAENLSLTLTTTNTDWVSDVVPLIKESFAKAGITAKIDEGESGGQYSKVDSGDYEVMIAPGDPSVFGNDADLLLRWWFSGETWPGTRMHWDDTAEFKKLTEMLDAAAKESDEAAQLKQWGEIYDLLSVEVPLWPLLHRKLPTGWDEGALKGFKPIPITGLSFLDVARTA